MSADVAEKVATILQEQADCLKELRNQASLRIDTFVSRNFTALENALQRDHHLMTRLGSLNQRLRDCLAGASLIHFLESISSERRAELQLQINKLADLAAGLVTLNRRNSRYVETSMASFQAIVQKLLPGSNSYGSHGYLQIESSNMKSREIRT